MFRGFNLINGTQRDDILNGFISSVEFSNIAESYGINIKIDESNNYIESEYLIDTQLELKSKYDLYMDTLEKSEYETTSAYNSRINQFINDEGDLLFKFDLDNTYDADTQTLYVYDTNLTRDRLIFDYGFLEHNHVNIVNFEDFNIEYGYVPNRDYWEESNSIFLKDNFLVSEVMNLDDNFFLIINATLSDEIPMAEHNWNKYTGTSNYINIEATSMLVVNGVNNIIYDEIVI